MAKKATSAKVRDRENQIKERERTIRTILPFVYQITQKLGEETGYEEGSSHTKISRQLKIDEFFFRTITGMTCMGGNQVSITLEGVEVFNLYHQSLTFDPRDEDGWELRTYGSGQWMYHLGQLMGQGVKKLQAKIAAEKRAAQQEQTKNLKEEEVTKSLEERAKRLLL